MFPEDAIVVPHLTVSMKDEALYGYVSAGNSNPFPAGMRFTFSSNRPWIVSASPDDDFLKLDWEYSNGAAELAETTEDSLSGAPVDQVLASIPTAGLLGNTVWLRMVKRGPRYATYYSTDGLNWVPVYEVGQSLSNVKVGLFAWNRPATTSSEKVTFAYFRVSNVGSAGDARGPARGRARLP